MAKRDKADQAEGEDSERHTGGVMIKASTLKKLLSYDDGLKEEIDERTGELREAIGNAVEKNHLNKDAYALVRKFRRMRLKKGAEIASTVHSTFLAYMEMSGEQKLLDAVMGLPLGGEDRLPAEVEDAGGKVARPEFGGRTAAPGL